MKLRIKGNEVYSVGPGGEVQLVYKLDSLRECAEVSHRGSSLRIVGFSDWRVQDIGGLIRFLETQERPDLILYAGDDIGRFRPPYENLFEQLAGLSRYGLCAVAGNDDAPSARELISGHNVYPVHSRALVLGEFAVVGVEGAPLFANDDQHRNKGSLSYPERFLPYLMRNGTPLRTRVSLSFRTLRPSVFSISPFASAPAALAAAHFGSFWRQAET